MTTEEKIAAIEASDLLLAFDGCHKIYLVEDSEVPDVTANGYDLHWAKELRTLLDKSCGLEFVHAWNLGRHPWDIAQGELDEAGYYDDADEEVP